MLNGLQMIRAAILLRSLVLIREKGDPKHKKGTQIPKKSPLEGTHCGTMPYDLIIFSCPQKGSKITNRYPWGGYHRTSSFHLHFMSPLTS